MIIGIFPTVDLAFKLMLGSPDHTAITVHFLNAVLGGSPRICQATILNPFLGKTTEGDKLSILDIKARDDAGRYINIEMQTSLAAGLSQRLAYYASRLYVDQLGEGQAYNSLCPAISICVLQATMFPQIPRFHLDFRFRERSGDLLTDDLQVHLIELPKSRVPVHNIQEASPLERWAFLFLNAHRIDTDELRRLIPDPEIDEALGVLEMISRTPETRELYEARLKAQRDAEARLEYALNEGLAKGLAQGLEQGLAQGLEQGLEQGRLQGIQQGLEQGREQGRAEGQAVGEQIGHIRLIQRLLKIEQTPSGELSTLSSEELTARIEALERQLEQSKRERSG